MSSSTSTNSRPTAMLLLLAFLACVLGSKTVAAKNVLRLNFGVYSSNKPSEMVKVFRPVLKQLEADLSRRLEQEVDIRMQIAKDYDQGISHLVNGHVDFSHFGPASYVEAKRMNPDINIIAVENKNNSKISYGIIAVKEDSPIRQMSDLRGRSFAFGDDGSTIGRFLSQLELRQAGIHAMDLSRYEYLGRHDKVGTAVGAGSFDAGALNEKTFKKLVANGEPIKELVRFPNVSKPWISRSGLPDNILNALRESVLSITHEQALAAMKIDGFLEGDDEDYSVIRRAMEDNAAFFEEREKSDTASVSQTANGASEPDNSAALPDLTVTYDSNDQNITDSTSSNNLPRKSSGLKTITLNVDLPIDLFDAENTDAPDSITINIKLPEKAQ